MLRIGKVKIKFNSTVFLHEIRSRAKNVFACFKDLYGLNQTLLLCEGATLLAPPPHIIRSTVILGFCTKRNNSYFAIANRILLLKNPDKLWLPNETLLLLPQGI
jgi:hypothetical protein